MTNAKAAPNIRSKPRKIAAATTYMACTLNIVHGLTGGGYSGAMHCGADGQSAQPQILAPFMYGWEQGTVLAFIGLIDSNKEIEKRLSSTSEYIVHASTASFQA